MIKKRIFEDHLLSFIRFLSLAFFSFFFHVFFFFFLQKCSFKIDLKKLEFWKKTKKRIPQNRIFSRNLTFFRVHQCFKMFLWVLSIYFFFFHFLRTKFFIFVSRLVFPSFLTSFFLEFLVSLWPICVSCSTFGSFISWFSAAGIWKSSSFEVLLSKWTSVSIPSASMWTFLIKLWILDLLTLNWQAGSL